MPLTRDTVQYPTKLQPLLGAFAKLQKADSGVNMSVYRSGWQGKTQIPMGGFLLILIFEGFSFENLPRKLNFN
jgi:hypothetical protein